MLPTVIMSPSPEPDIRLWHAENASALAEAVVDLEASRAREAEAQARKAEARRLLAAATAQRTELEKRVEVLSRSLDEFRYALSRRCTAALPDDVLRCIFEEAVRDRSLRRRFRSCGSVRTVAQGRSRLSHALVARCPAYPRRRQRGPTLPPCCADTFPFARRAPGCCYRGSTLPNRTSGNCVTAVGRNRGSIAGRAQDLGPYFRAT